MGGKDWKGTSSPVNKEGVWEIVSVSERERERVFTA
jgi:hypothetical protein